MNDKQRKAMWARLQKKQLLINRPNPKIGMKKVSFNKSFTSPKFVVDAEHTVGKLSNSDIPTGLIKTIRVVPDPSTPFMRYGERIFLIGNSRITEKELQKIAYDARL